MVVLPFRFELVLLSNLKLDQCSEQCVFQVTSLRVALVAEEKQLQQIDLDSNFPVVAASIVDPYVALLTQNGRLMLFHLVLHPHVHLQVERERRLFWA